MLSTCVVADPAQKVMSASRCQPKRSPLRTVRDARLLKRTTMMRHIFWLRRSRAVSNSFWLVSARLCVDDYVIVDAVLKLEIIEGTQK